MRAVFSNQCTIAGRDVLAGGITRVRVNAEVNFPGSAEVKVPTLVEDVGGQPLSDEGVSVREGRDFRRLAGVGVLAWCGAGMR